MFYCDTVSSVGTHDICDLGASAAPGTIGDSVKPTISKLPHSSESRGPSKAFAAGAVGDNRISEYPCEYVCWSTVVVGTITDDVAPDWPVVCSLHAVGDPVDFDIHEVAECVTNGVVLLMPHSEAFLLPPVTAA